MDQEDEKEVSRRELLEQAWGEAEKDESDAGPAGAAGGEGAPKAGENIEKPLAGDAEEGKTELEGKAGDPKKLGEKKQPDADRQERKAAADPDDKAGKAGKEPVTDRAPNSWKPAVREHWATLPKEVRETISTRELHIQQELTQTANIRKFANEFANVIGPFQHIIRAQNSTPLKAIQNVMATSAGLFQGSAQQKAEIVANVIGTYGVDLQMLDGILANMQKNGGIRPPPGVTRPEAPPQWAKPLFDFMTTAEQSRQQQQQRMQQEANAEVENHQEKPFFEDLREEMADILEVAANRGRTLTLEQAYERAVALNPEISKIIEQRKAAEQAKRADPAAAKRAASLIRGAPNSGGAMNKGAKASRRETMSALWDEAT